MKKIKDFNKPEIKSKIYEIKGQSAIENFPKLLTSDKKYFYWDNARFKSFEIGDIVFFISRSQRIALCTIVDSLDVKNSYKDGKRSVEDLDYLLKFAASNESEYEKFIRFKIIEYKEIPSSWNYKDPSTFSGRQIELILYQENKRNNIQNRIAKCLDLYMLFESQESKAVINDILDQHGYINHQSYSTSTIKIDDKKILEIKEKDMNYNSENFPLNQILYGPPGTGKTYNTINYALSIIKGYPLEFLQNERKDQEKDKKYRDEFNELVKYKQIQFVTFHQSYSYEDFVEGMKPTLKDDSVVYEIEDGIFKTMCNEQYDFNSIWDKFIKLYESNGDIVFPLKRAESFKVTNVTDTHYQIIASNGNPQTVNTKERLRNIFYGDNKSTMTSYDNPILDFLRNLNGKTTRSSVLIIDEINRGNISKIFGELITLIEDTKRKGNTDELSVTLPYSKVTFTVPNNLYIIGTMNSTDKSIAFIDTALRRRFSFVEFKPLYNLLSTDITGINLQEMLKTINNRIEALLDKDHHIGHSYFMSISTIEDLKSAFQDKLIPLLEEYFFGDYRKIQLVLGDNKKKKEDQIIQEKALFFDSLFGESLDDLEGKTLYETINFKDKKKNFNDLFKLIYQKQLDNKET